MIDKIKAEIEETKQRIVSDKLEMKDFLKGYLGGMRNALMFAEELEKELKLKFDKVFAKQSEPIRTRHEARKLTFDIIDEIFGEFEK